MHEHIHVCIIKSASFCSSRIIDQNAVRNVIDSQLGKQRTGLSRLKLRHSQIYSIGMCVVVVVCACSVVLASTSQEVALYLLQVGLNFQGLVENLDGLPVVPKPLLHLCQHPHQVHLWSLALTKG